jgi:hypothetical protein
MAESQDEKPRKQQDAAEAPQPAPAPAGFTQAELKAMRESLDRDILALLSLC